MRVVVSLLTLLFIAVSFVNFGNAGAQTTRPTLISHPDSTRAIAFESVTRQREPFTTTAQVRFGSDSATRIMIFAMNLPWQPGETITADAEDASHTIYPLTVEHVDSVPDQPWASSLVIRLAENMPQAGDVLVRIRAKLGGSWLGRMMDCTYCLSVWIAAPLASFVGTGAVEWLIAWWAVSGGACLIERYSPRREEG